MSKQIPLLLGFCCCLLLVGVDAAYKRFSCTIDPEVDYTPLQLITSKGYLGEEHWVPTSDGYILALYRIPVGKNQNKAGPRPVFFLQHGLLGSCANWLTNLANESLGYILADHGYDVWMGNVRGNIYSRNHTTLKPTQKKFWNFTFDQHAQIDLPTMLDYVLKVTGQKQLFYVGHSQGTIMGFIGLTFNQTLASHVKAFFALAPVAYLEHIQGAFRILSDLSNKTSLYIEWILSSFTDGEFLPNSPLFNFLSRLPVYYTHMPAGSSVKNALHYVQWIKSGRIVMYNYGTRERNIQHYGVGTSPSYNVTDMKVSMALFTGGRDLLANPIDVARLLPMLNSTRKLFYHKNIEHYDHLDFIWGMDAATVVYSDIIALAEKMKDQI